MPRTFQGERALTAAAAAMPGSPQQQQCSQLQEQTAALLLGQHGVIPGEHNALHVASLVRNPAPLLGHTTRGPQMDSQSTRGGTQPAPIKITVQAGL